MTAMLPEKLGSFEITGLLGEGGSSLVYAARDAEREVALKVLRPDLELSPREAERFLEEAERMSRVKHPALVPVLGKGTLPDGRPFITMPLLRGQNVMERAAELPVPIRRAVALFGDLASAVGAIHEAGLVHRDIKPENVLWEGATDRLVLLDLGIARDTLAAPSTTTRAGLARGTPAYMAPERLFGQPATIQSDVYELALVLFFLLTGRLPWDDQDPRGRMSPRMPAELGVELPPALTATLLAALSVDFEARPATAMGLLTRVRESIADPLELAATRAVRVDALASARTELSPHTPHASSRAVQGADVDVQSAGTLASISATAPPRKKGGPTTALAAAAALAAATIGLGMWRLRADASSANGSPTSTPISPPASAPSPSLSPVPVPVPVPVPALSSLSSLAPAPAPAPSSASAPALAPALAPPSSSAEGQAGTPAGGEPVLGVPHGAKRPSPAPPPSGPMPPSCQQLIALMCSPTSGARPEECASSKANVARWQQTLPPDVAKDTCQSAFDASQAGLVHRRNWKP